MIKNAIGLIETRGLVAAIEALDASLKAANVEFISYRFTTGGLICVIVTGDVGAVRAAVDAGSAAAAKVGELVASHVIPRPADDTLNIIDEIKDKKAIYEKEIEMPKTEQDMPDTDKDGRLTDEETADNDDDNDEETKTEEDMTDEDSQLYTEDELKAAVERLREMLKGTREESTLDSDKRLDKYGVRALRKVIRALPIQDVDKSQISSMRKKDLIITLMDFIEKEGRDNQK
ncbi:MAG: BMC domain-containing protein [Tepidanaerobacter acetatoxydans]|jgi:ethanolamine utilization protein EutM|nr:MULTISPECIES: BMC domain-containing protein [Tepidanaerobacter]NLU09929.1 BMC domain-containing protein [Tepidanaerobacter acetatoxydans]